ncbi:MAG TPA: hypothetical protein VGX94_15125 [Terriglobia bacterium]|nr:hypothetical protein [Terriglobia bacterium]HEV2498794.1 hypothetical protein [Terriglobia bacterium]
MAKKLEYLEVIHPLLDAPEQKCNAENLGPMRMSRGVKASLLALRVYLISMTLLLLYHVLGLAGVIRL